MTDLITIALFFLLFGSGIGAICYMIGKSHGHAAGRLAGLQEARGEYLPKIIRAKFDGAKAARIAQAQQFSNNL